MGTSSNVKYFWAAVSFLIALAICISLSLSLLKQESLSYQTRDYAYYLEFAVRTLDPSYPQAVSVNPNGYNVFRFGGTEAMTSIHQGIHLEPGKYVTALLFQFAKSPLALFVWYCTLFFLPLWYFALRARGKLSDVLILILIATYVLFPSMLLAPTNDLRPFILMAPALLFALTAFTLTTSTTLRLASLVMLFFVREEGLVFAAPLVLAAALEAFRLGGRRELFRRTAPLAAAWILTAAASGMYFLWTGYENTLLRSLGKHSFLLMTLSVLVGVAATACWLLWRRRLMPYLADALYFVPLILVGMQFLLVVRTSGLSVALLHPYFAVGMAAFLPLIARYAPLLAYRARSLLMLVSICFLLTLLVFGLYAPQGTLHTARLLNERKADASLVHAYAESLVPGYVMTDYDTHQAFYRQPFLFNYERLPGTLLSGDDRYYPKNEATVRKLLEDTDLIVVSVRSVPVIKDMIADRFSLTEQNASYAVFVPSR